MQEQQQQPQPPPLHQQQHGSHPSPSVFRPIAPLPHSALSPVLTPNLPSNLASCTVSPLPSPQTKPNPNQGRMLPFETPPVSPFSNPMTHDTNQPPFRLPPPLKQLPIPGQQHQQPQPYSQQLVSPTNCTNPANSANASLGSQQPAQASPTKYERILPKGPGPSTSVFSIPITPGLNSNGGGGSRPIMQHHTSVIHPPVPPHGHRISTGDRPMSTADQRELARKTSHSAIERRRRERINDKIMQLKELIPSCAEQDHLHKLNILQSAIEYIQYLQDVITDQREAKSDSRSEESRPAKRSKFDRYEIPNRRSNVSEARGDKFNDEPKQKISSATASSGSALATDDPAPAADPEDAKVLLMLSADSKAELPPRSPQRSSASPASLPMLQSQTRECSTQTPSEWVPKRSIASHGTNADGEVVDEQRTSTTVKGSDRMQEDDDEMEEEEEQPPRRSMTIQQLLLQDAPTQTDD